MRGRGRTCGAASTRTGLSLALHALDTVDFTARALLAKAPAKQPSVLTDRGFIQAMLREARRLTADVGVVVGSPRFKAELRRLTAGADWAAMSAKDRDEVIDEAAKLIQGLPSKFAEGVEVTLDEEGLRVVGSTAKALGEKWSSLRVDPSFALENKEGVEALRTTTSMYFADEYEKQADRFRDRAARVLSDGLAQGLGTSELAADLGAEFTGAAIHSSYWETVASVHVSRARSFGSFATYKEAGVERYEVVAMMDERTTPICQAMNGRVLEVQAALDNLEEVEGAETLEEVKRVAPLMRLQNGQPVLPGGQRVTSKTPSKKLMSLGVHGPPYHYRCRTTLVPVFEE